MDTVLPDPLWTGREVKQMGKHSPRGEESREGESREGESQGRQRRPQRGPGGREYRAEGRGQNKASAQRLPNSTRPKALFPTFEYDMSYDRWHWWYVSFPSFLVVHVHYFLQHLFTLYDYMYIKTYACIYMLMCIRMC